MVAKASRCPLFGALFAAMSVLVAGCGAETTPTPAVIATPVADVMSDPSPTANLARPVYLVPTAAPPVVPAATVTAIADTATSPNATATESATDTAAPDDATPDGDTPVADGSTDGSRQPYVRHTRVPRPSGGKAKEPTATHTPKPTATDKPTATEKPTHTPKPDTTAPATAAPPPTSDLSPAELSAMGQLTYAAPGCMIKGNISTDGKIYHMPGQSGYDRIVITPSKGERWFCTEADATANGWRKAKR